MFKFAKSLLDRGIQKESRAPIAPSPFIQTDAPYYEDQEPEPAQK